MASAQTDLAALSAITKRFIHNFVTNDVLSGWLRVRNGAEERGMAFTRIRISALERLGFVFLHN